MMVVVSRLIGKKVENYLFKVGETRQTSTRHVQNIRWSGFFFAQNWFYNNMRKKNLLLILLKQNSTNNSQFKMYPSKSCSSFNQSQHNSKYLTNEVKEEQKIYWYISDLVRASYFKGGLISESFYFGSNLQKKLPELHFFGCQDNSGIFNGDFEPRWKTFWD